MLELVAPVPHPYQPVRAVRSRPAAPSRPLEQVALVPQPPAARPSWSLWSPSRQQAVRAGGSRPAAPIGPLQLVALPAPISWLEQLALVSQPPSPRQSRSLSSPSRQQAVRVGRSGPPAPIGPLQLVALPSPRQPARAGGSRPAAPNRPPELFTRPH